MKPNIKSSEKGFTLIELVVVMAIIAVLASLMTAAIVAARKQAMNTKRLGDVKAFKIALEGYYTKYNQYPINCYPDSNLGGGMVPIYQHTATYDVCPNWGTAASGPRKLVNEGLLVNFQPLVDNRIIYCAYNGGRNYGLYVINEPTSIPAAADLWVSANCKYSTLTFDKTNVTDFSYE